MTAKKKQAARAKEPAPRSAVETFRDSAHEAFGRRATWIQYSPGGKTITVGVEDTVDDDTAFGGARIVGSHQVAIPLGEADSQILSALTDALSWAAEDLGAEVYEPPEPEE